MAEDVLHTTHYDNGYHICTCGVRFARGDKHPDTIRRVQVVLFKTSGKYYTEEFWDIPESTIDYRMLPSGATEEYTRKVIGPYDMDSSPNFRRIDDGAVLVVSQEPWGFPHLFPGDYPSRSAD